MAPNNSSSGSSSAKLAPESLSTPGIYKDFHWVETDEPHATRRRLILAKHPEIKQLFVREPKTFLVVVFIFVSQLMMANWVQHQSLPVFLFLMYAYGGTVNHTLQLAVHELSHNLCFESVAANQWLAIFANFVTGFPSAVTFKAYHMEHHQYQGADQLDTDVPTEWEVNTFQSSTWRKIIWVLLQPAFYGLRPLIVKPKALTLMEVVNAICVFTFDWAVYTYLGPYALLYLIGGSLIGLGLHPAAGHFIAEHYEFFKGTETYSYYGPLNRVNLNVGYHNEHHDFPKIPWSKLPRVREIAPEFYNNLPHHDSYIKVFWDYITDANIGPFSRVKRPQPEAYRRRQAKTKN
eukprot:TRINITY_DN112913_c0_g1_i1.p1 TRINITY_DN112913_c0_g1~~TRINITY_DN112913_c0_g1_i1.p1  ORF type:complete len:362 (-),score=186.43 TRINITY_DN112913_c0_g1_i1:188-1231(-)